MNQHYNEVLAKAYQSLNPEQKKAVDRIEGSVLVVAGPGTGKTQLLAVRICNILSKTDANPNNILCLTYTDAGSIAMRERLISFIGAEAYNIPIVTFHAFCNQVIKENFEYFGGYRELQIASDLDLIDIINQIIDEFPNDHPLKRFKGNIYYDRPRLKNLFQTMKQENWSVDDIESAYKQLEIEIYDDPDYLYKRNYKDRTTGIVHLAGSPKQKSIDSELKKYSNLLLAAKELEKYKALLEEKERFDYQDMILWVIEKFKLHEELLAKYQERYQYMLVDEYQDTNGSQNELLFLLADYWEQPNLFVVGDDDQSIYRFQGANMNNIIDFKEKYDPFEVVLTKNYRSSQEILDSYGSVIKENVERLVNKYPYLDKTLIESRTDITTRQKPIIVKYFNTVHEEKDIANQIIALHEQGIHLNEVAVIYRKHKNVHQLVKYLELMNIPLNIKKRVNIFELPEIERLLTILKYLDEESRSIYSGEYLLFQILHYEYFQLSPRDIGRINQFCYLSREGDPRRILDVLLDKKLLEEIGIENLDDYMVVGKLFESWRTDMYNVTIQVLFEKILTEGGVLTKIMLSSEKAWRLQVVNTFFNLIKDESAKSPKMKLVDLLDLVNKMIEARIDLPLNKVVYASNGVNFVTAHSSKGLEFEYVFIINADSSNWVSGRNTMNNFSFPKTLVPSSSLSDIEDDRRLFYVAMSRAKTHLHISFSQQTEEEKAMEAVQFIYEIVKEDKEQIKSKSISDDEVLEYKFRLLHYQEGSIDLIDKDSIDKALKDYKVSVTSLNKYLRCPLTFYFENILRVPLARNLSMGFGNAIHHALEHYFTDIEKNPNRSIGTKKELVDYFHRGMSKYKSHFTEKEFASLSVHGENTLSLYYDEYKDSWSAPKQYVAEYPVTLTEYKGIPITGKIDKVAIYDDRVEVIDYKTGSFVNASSKLKPPLGDDDIGGDYWRQLVFYKMLMDGDKTNNWTMYNGTMDFVESIDDKFKRHTIVIDPFELDIVEKQLIDSYQKIKAHQFEPGCGKEDCTWCEFVKNNFNLITKFETYFDDEEL